MPDKGSAPYPAVLRLGLVVVDRVGLCGEVRVGLCIEVREGLFGEEGLAEGSRWGSGSLLPSDLSLARWSCRARIIAR